MKTISEKKYFQILSDLINKEGEDVDICPRCQYYSTWQEPQPYGDTIAYESLWECTCEEFAGCARVNQILEDRKNE